MDKKETSEREGLQFCSGPRVNVRGRPLFFYEVRFGATNIRVECDGVFYNPELAATLIKIATEKEKERENAAAKEQSGVSSVELAMIIGKCNDEFTKIRKICDDALNTEECFMPHAFTVIIKEIDDFLKDVGNG